MKAEQPQQWTVTVSGSERHDGEKPWTYCVSASSMDEAKSRVLAHHQQVQEDDDLTIVEDECFPGAPPADVWYRWNYQPDPDESGSDRVTKWAERRSSLERAGSITDVAGRFRASDIEAVAIVTELAESFRRVEAMEHSDAAREGRLSGLDLRSRIHELVNNLPLQHGQQKESSVEADDARRRRLAHFGEQGYGASSPRSADTDPPTLCVADRAWRRRRVGGGNGVPGRHGQRRACEQDSGIVAVVGVVRRGYAGSGWIPAPVRLPGGVDGSRAAKDSGGRRPALGCG